MEVILSIFSISLILICISLYKRNLRLSDTQSQMNDYLDKALDDHKLCEQELQITKSKLQIIQETSVDPNEVVNKEVHNKIVSEKESKLTHVQSELEDITAKFEEVRGKQISERVRLGAVSENFAPFLDGFPYDRSKVKALFQPIDLIYFGEDEVVFIDVKSGNSQLSTKQRRIRDLVNEGKVRFEVHRIDDKGYDIK